MKTSESRKCLHFLNRIVLWAFAIHSVGLISGVSAFGYTEATLHRLAQASSLSYLSLDKMTSSPYYETCQLKPIAQVVDPASESGATIFMDKNSAGDNGQNKLVVACRGSASPKNFGTNLKFNLVPATRLSQSKIPPDAMVHQGFQDASYGLWRELGPPLMKMLIKDDASSTPSNVVFTGHSLGAATALLCSVHYRASFNNGSCGSIPSPCIITFGGPKLCNGILAQYLRDEALQGCDILHLVHGKDPILANNKQLWDSLGFENVGLELECDPNSPKVFAEERSIMPQASSLFENFAWNILDHCYYMGVFVGPRVLG